MTKGTSTHWTKQNYVKQNCGQEGERKLIACVLPLSALTLDTSEVKEESLEMFLLEKVQRHFAWGTYTSRLRRCAIFHDIHWRFVCLKSLNFIIWAIHLSGNVYPKEERHSTVLSSMSHGI